MFAKIYEWLLNMKVAFYARLRQFCLQLALIGVDNQIIYTTLTLTVHYKIYIDEIPPKL